MGELLPDVLSLNDWAIIWVSIGVGPFFIRIFDCMLSFLGPASGDFVSSLPLTSLSSGRKELPLFAEDIVAILFCLLLLRTCSRLMFFFTRTSGTYDCMEEKRELAS